MVIDNSCPLWGTGGKVKKYSLCIPEIRNELYFNMMGIFIHILRKIIRKVSIMSIILMKYLFVLR